MPEDKFPYLYQKHPHQFQDRNRYILLLIAQEEEMKQNLEEMMATQEEMKRREEAWITEKASLRNKEAEQLKELRKLKNELNEAKSKNGT